MAFKGVFICVALLLVMPAGDAGADFLVYKLGTKGQRRQVRGQGPWANAQSPASAPQGTGMYGRSSGAADAALEVTLYGIVKKDGGKIMYSHPEVGETLIFQPNQVEIKQAPTMTTLFNKMMKQAGKDPEAVMQTAVWGLKKGLLGESQHAVEKVLSLEPQHEAALRIRDLKKQIGVPLPDENDAVIEKQLRKIVDRSGMRVETSNHFILLHDTDAKADQGRHSNRAKERLRLVEQMYEKFVLLFAAQNVELDLPHDRLMVVLFKKRSDFQECATQMGSQATDLAGFWSPVHNLICFCDDSTTAESGYLRDERDRLAKIAADAKKAGSSLERQRDSETLRQIKINGVLLEIDRWRSDMASISREVTHQMAANTELLPRRVEIPRWVNEGLAMYFQAPSDEAWGGIGAVDDLRIEDYRAFQDDRRRSNIDFIIEDRSLDDSTAGGTSAEAAAQVWSLTYFLFENHRDELMSYYRMLGNMPPDVALSPDLLSQVFSGAFGSDHKALQQEWRGSMRTLKSDIARMETAGEKTD
jgi:hypothetical protein